jgi:hypothetical protein
MKRIERLAFILFLTVSAWFSLGFMPWLAPHGKGPAGAGGGGGPTYLIEENFETPTTGYDSGVTWTESGTVDPDNSTTPLVGSQSCLLSGSYANITGDFTGQTDVWAYGRFKPVDFWTGDTSYAGIFALRSAGAEYLLSVNVRYDSGSGGKGEVVLYANGAASSASSTLLDRATEYHIWVRYVESGTCILAMSTSATRPSVDGSGAVYLTKTGGTGTASEVLVGNIQNEPMRADRILVSTSEIGNSP